MGTAFARRLAAAGHDVAITSRDPGDAEKVARTAAGSTRVVPQQEIGGNVDVLIAATPFPSQIEALQSSGRLDGMTVVEISNPMNEDMSGLAIGHTTSAAEEIAKAIPGAKVVKAFNTVFAQVLGDKPPRGDEAKVQVFYAGDDESAKRQVRSLIESMGFEPVDAGPLRNARSLEPMGMLNIYLGYVAKLGTDIALAVRKVSQQPARPRADDRVVRPKGGVADQVDREPRLDERHG